MIAGPIGGVSVQLMPNSSEKEREFAERIERHPAEVRERDCARLAVKITRSLPSLPFTRV